MKPLLRRSPPASARIAAAAAAAALLLSPRCGGCGAAAVGGEGGGRGAAAASAAAAISDAFVPPTPYPRRTPPTATLRRLTPRRLLSRRPSPPRRLSMVVSDPSVSGGGDVGTDDDPNVGGNSTSTPSSTSSSAPSSATSKLRQLKDRMWVRETLEDLTTAEFASSIDAQQQRQRDAGSGPSGAGGGAGTRAERRKKRAVDFENIISKLERRVGEMCVTATVGDESAGEFGRACYPLSMDPASPPGDDEPCYVLAAGRGMGSVVYSDEQRDALLMRILASRQTLLRVMRGEEGGGGDGAGASPDDEAGSPISAGDLDQIRVQLQDDLVKEMRVGESSSSAGEERERAKRAGDPNLYIRDDGTIDWDGAIQDRTAIKKFGASVWARINGMDPESVVGEGGGDSGEVADRPGEEKKVTVKIAETEEIRRERMRLEEVREELERMERQHTALLNSAVAAGSAVANVKLASLDPSLRNRIRLSAEALEAKREEVSFQVLNYEMERIFTYLEGEMGNTATKGYIPLQDRLNVAEFGLLESQIQNLRRQLAEGDSIDADVLSVLSEQLMDFKRRLGIDYYVTGFTYDQEAIQRWLGDLVIKTKDGLAFYVKGCQLFWDDILYSARLIGRALRGYILQPREVRTLRRTIKDLFNFIPFIIILIIPLSPVGHVLVFGAIQRVFPDFFPSCFTERRQNLLQLYESTEYSEVTINETWQEKITRIFEALVYTAANTAKRLYKSIGGELSAPDKKDRKDQ